MLKTIIQQQINIIKYILKDELELLKDIQKLFTMNNLEGNNKTI